MIRKLKMLGARAVFFLVVAAGLGFGVIAAAMGTVIGSLLMLGVLLSQTREAQKRAEQAAPDTVDRAANPA